MTEKPMATHRLLRHPGLRSGLLFLNFFLIILAYYQVKPASRSLFLEYASAAQLPYLWTGSAALLIALMPMYQRMVRRYSRLHLVLGTCGVIALLLIVFRLLMVHPSAAVAIGFYLLVDVFSVILVEQFWSLTDSVFRSSDGKRWYGLIASGGLVGGLAGGTVASALIRLTPLQTPDLLLVAAALLVLMMVMLNGLSRFGLYERGEPEAHPEAEPVSASHGSAAEAWRTLRGSRYLMLIALILLLSQVCEPIVEYQFLHLVERSYTEADARTAFLSTFLSVLNAVALMVNLIVTPIVHRGFGAIAGLMVQPVVLGAAAMLFTIRQQLWIAGTMKIADRALSYSINRASRELLYIPTDAATIFRAKAWIDMVGYRSFKIIGNVVILLLTQWLAWPVSDAGLSWVVVALCAGWIYAVWAIRNDYLRLNAAAAETPPATAT
ncbi:NTP/NDP exchange transporter [Sinimarinibacterium sp. CAU 1509]|uniref:NTP/NDP exchange transporter n=1 Tax=Sinimarinibacterium sp. CAU 1509 TaxID=2562283 RepID=UPI001B7FB42A|nr:Npt1/Npt2 family nucleotide transporter [Sinimarinibacterium sp. CAU 1509]